MPTFILGLDGHLGSLNMRVLEHLYPYRFGRQLEHLENVERVGCVCKNEDK